MPLDDLMSSVALWYQIEPHKPWLALPPGAQRLPFSQMLLLRGHEAVGAAKHSAAPLEVQELGGVTDGKQLWFKPSGGEGWVEVSFDMPKEQSAVLYAKMVHSWDYGTYRVKLDDQEMAKLNLYATEPTPTEHKLGLRKLAAGPHTLRFECVGKSTSSAGYFLGFDALEARIPVYSRAADADLRTLQKAK
jgi:hypothetical protein